MVLCRFVNLLGRVSDLVAPASIFVIFAVGSYAYGPCLMLREDLPRAGARQRSGFLGETGRRSAHGFYSFRIIIVPHLAQGHGVRLSLVVCFGCFVRSLCPVAPFFYGSHGASRDGLHPRRRDTAEHFAHSCFFVFGKQFKLVRLALDILALFSTCAALSTQAA